MPLLALAFLAFIGLGLPDPLPGSLWPELQPHFGVANAGLGLVLAANAAGYITAGLLAARLIRGLGIGLLLSVSLAATATAALGQGLAPPWWGFVALSVLAGLGGGAVDAALNLFAAHRFRPRHLNWLHGCWGIGATLGPLAAALLLAGGFGWQAGYLAVGTVLGVLALAFGLTRRRWDAGGHQGGGADLSALAVLRHPVARLQIVLFFLYTGIEAGAGQWAATILTAARGATPAEGAAAATTFFAALTAGRIGLGFVVDRVGADLLLRLLTPVTVLGALLLASGWADFAALGLMALALAPIYPTVMARTPSRLGTQAAAQAVGFQVSAAMLGVAVVPALLGLAADLAGARILPWLLALGCVGLSALIWRLPAAKE